MLDRRRSRQADKRERFVKYVSGAAPGNTYDNWAVGPAVALLVITSVDATTAPRGPGAVP